MKNIAAIGFDLVNTLVIIKPQTLEDASNRLTKSLQKSGFSIDTKIFLNAYKNVITKSIQRIRKDWKETHNRFWIKDALLEQGYEVSHDDQRIVQAVEDYFTAFYGNADLIPGTIEMLVSLKARYKLGLLSNFTHAPAAKEIIDRTGLEPFFNTILISGDFGFRKPHPKIFRRFVKQLGVDKNKVLFVGDDPEADIMGSTQAGLKPVWITYVKDHGIKTAPFIVPGDIEKPGADVPRISTWEDLMSLLCE